MPDFLKSLSLISLIALAGPALAQETTGDDASPDPLELNMGEPDINVGDIYVEGEFTDWEIRCIKSESGFDLCQLYQLLDDGNGNFRNETDLANTLDPSPYLGMRLNTTCADRPPVCRPDYFCP